MPTAVTAFLVSCVVTLLVVRISKRAGMRLLDHELSGPQKFHRVPVPRIGGVGIVAGIAVSLVAGGLASRLDGQLAMLLLVCAAPAFLAGFVEDLTKAIRPRWRLAFTMLSAALGVALIDAVIVRTDIPGLDWVVGFPLGALAVTMFVVGGVANSLNIIDGFNGLASMCAVLMLWAIGYVAFQVGDTTLVLLCAAGIGAVLGFFVWNYPLGLIFLGDGGAYVLGFYVAELAILLMHRHPQVSPMFPLLACIYPVFETVFSIYRRRFLRGQPAGMPDGIHLHSLVYRRLIRWAAGTQAARRASPTRRNSMTSPYLWLLCMLAVVPAMGFWDNTPVLAAFIAAFAIVYTALYWRIVRFRAPRWMVTRH